MKKLELRQLIREEIRKTVKENQNLPTNDEFGDRYNKFYDLLLQSYDDMSDHKITFDEATDNLFTWIKANFK
tara:strand:+ start:2785 stop:3000 length:216 start_codon:yes stop_codon:yes gene_type:complete